MRDVHKIRFTTYPPPLLEVRPRYLLIEITDKVGRSRHKPMQKAGSNYRVGCGCSMDGQPSGISHGVVSKYGGFESLQVS